MALQALYQHDLLGTCSGEELRAFCTRSASPRAAELAIELVQGCLQHQEALDDVIRRTAENWELERMATSDRNILRLGVFELLFKHETPPKVAINEAIELAKKYSTANSPTFVNGVLDRVYTTHAAGARPDAHPGPSETGNPSGAVGDAKDAGEPVAGAGPPADKPDPEAQADLHVHSTASDGSYEPAELPAMAVKAGLSALALTDHDSLEGVAAAGEAADAVGIELVPGVELTAYTALPGSDGQVELHIAGLLVNPDSVVLANRLRELRAARVERIREMARKLQELGMEIESERVLERAPGAAVGRVHVAQEMVDRGCCKHLSEAFDRYIGSGCPAYVPKQRMTPPEAIELVRSAGGCAVLCHPGLTPGVEGYIEELVENGLDALEVYCPMHTARDKKRWLETARRFGLAVSGGSDFHGAAKPDIHIGQEKVSFVEFHELKRRAGRRAGCAR